MAAARALRETPAWQELRNALLEQSRKFMNTALEMPVPRDDAVGYARALRDVWLALESSTYNQPVHQVTKPGPVKRNV